MARIQASSNGTHRTPEAAPAPYPAYIPPQGRPPRKAKDPVRVGLAQCMRSLKEITNNWGMAVVMETRDVAGTTVTDYKLASPEAAKLCGDQIRFLSAKLTSLTADVEKRISEV